EIDTYTTKTTRMANKDDILFSVRAPVGDINFAPTDLCIGRGLSCIKPISVHKEFLYYLLIGNIRMYESKSTGTIFSSINKKELENLEFKIPSFNDQKKIGDFLWSIDSKIEVNNSIISNLEELAQTLFKHWFVDFEFPNEEGKPYKSSGGKMVESELGMIPEGWKIKELNDISKEIICGKTPKTSVKEYYGGSLPFITIPDMHSQVFALNTARYLTEEGQKSQMKKTLPPNSICVSCIATPGLVMLTCVPSQTNQQINSVIPYEEDTYFLYLTLKNMSNLIKELGSGGSTTLNLNKTQFSKIKITYPIQGIREKFNEKIESLFSKILCLQKENQTLINMRDTILTKQLSGEIEKQNQRTETNK